MKKYDAAIIGSGPNGLAAGIILAKAGLSVVVIEAKDQIGGGTRTSELTLPGFSHDVCSAIHPLGAASPLFQILPLDRFGLKWIYPPRALVHPFDDGSAVFISNSVEETARNLNSDEAPYKSLMMPLVENNSLLLRDILSPLSFPAHPFKLIHFGLNAMQPAAGFAKRKFFGIKARSLFAGLSAHSILALNKLFTTAFGLLLAMTAHKPGWPLPEGGSKKISGSLAEYFLSLGGDIITGRLVKSLKDIPDCRIKVFDLTPKQIITIMGNDLPSGYKKRLERYRYGPGVFKIDYALSEPVPFTAEESKTTAAIHLGGSIDEITRAEKMVWNATIPDKPFVIFVQPSIFDKSRAPKGKHTAWAYCHVPNGSDTDMTTAIENQIERFAPGFRDVILAKNTMNTAALENYNNNYVGGDINGGMQDWKQLFTRPVLGLSPYSMPLKGFYVCSSSTPPGGGVHGMCGYNAAKKILSDYNITSPVKLVTD